MVVSPLSLFFAILLYCVIIQAKTVGVKLKMPQVQPNKEDSYICTSVKLPQGDSYIVEYEPDAHKETVHHMLLFGCDEPGSAEKSWNCGEMGVGTCAAFESILFAWARDAPPLELPKGVGFKVGGRSKIKYLVLQMHYVHPLKGSEYDSSGLTLHMRTEKQPNLASIFLLYAVSAKILPHAKGFHVNVACKYDSDQEIHAFAFRTHSHDLGRVITGYRVRNGTWTLLGKGDPHAPQAFYPMKNVTTIRKGDILVSRCTYDTYNTGRTEITTMGSTSSDEMCNFYLMYYRSGRSHVKIPEGCWDQVTFRNLFSSIPKDSDVALSSSPATHHHNYHHRGHPHRGQHTSVSQHTVKGSGTKASDTHQEPGAGGDLNPGVVVKNYTSSVKGYKATDSGIIEGKSNVHNPDSEQSETTRTNPGKGTLQQNVRYNPSDDVMNGDITEGETSVDIPESESNESQEPISTSLKKEVEQKRGRHPSNHLKHILNSVTGYNSTDDVTPSNVREEKLPKYVIYPNVLEKPANSSSTNKSFDVSGGERSNYVTHDANTDVTTSTVISERTTNALLFTDKPATVHKGKQDIHSRVKVVVESSTTGIKQTAHTTVQVEGTKPSTDDAVKKEHGLKVGPSQTTINRSVDKVSFVDNWPSSGVANRLGQVTAVAVDTDGRVLVFHRAGRAWDFDTFNEDNTFRYPRIRGTIHKSTIFILDAKSGKLLKEWGKNMFYLPHGLTVDHQDNVWVTDVGRHQVMKFKRGEFHKPSLTLGENLIPGSDERHFCKPTSVAVEKSGIFYVADGYCNGRIMKFSSRGLLLKKWGRPLLGRDLHPGPSTFDVPHSLALDEKHDMLYVADRENGRIQCFDSEGRFHKQISSEMFGRLFAVSYNDEDNLLYAVNGPINAKAQGFTIDPSTSKILATWSPQNKGFSQPHAVVSNGSDIYVAEIGPDRVWRIEIRRQEELREEKNFGRGINAALVNKPTQISKKRDDGDDGHSKKETGRSNVPAVVILTILSVPAIILLLIGVISKVKGRKRQHKYDMMNEALGNQKTPGTWCNSMNCCSRSYHNMEELYLMDSDSDLEIFPDVHVNKK